MQAWRLTQDYYRLLPWGVVIGLVSGGTAVLFRVLAISLPAVVWHGGPNLLQAGVDAVRLPARSPNLNSNLERFIRSV